MNAIVIAKGVCAASALLALGSMLVFGSLGAWKELDLKVPLSASEARAEVVQSDMPAFIVRWSAPEPSPRDAAWTYEVFTPPEIYYDGATQKFTVIPQQTEEADGVAAKSGFGLELVEVRRVPFRLQLVGYVGEEGRYLGTFENLESGETFLARAGCQLPELGLVITDFFVRRESVAIPQSAPVEELMAVAAVHDLRTKGEVMLRHSERSYTEQLCARVRDVADHDEYEAKVGDTIRIGAAHYVIEKLQLTPPLVEVRKEAGRHGSVAREILSLAPIL